MDWSAAKVIVDIVEFVVLGVIAIYVYLRTANQVTADRLDALAMQLTTQMRGHGERLSTLEAAVNLGPTHDDLKRLHARMDEISNELHLLTGEFRVASRTLNMIQEHLLRGGGE